MLDRWIEGSGLLDVVGDLGIGCIAYSPLQQGLLTSKYLDGVPAGSRASREDSLGQEDLTQSTLARVRALDAIARERGQTLAQTALAWVLRDPRMTSLLIGASSVAQLEENVAALENTAFTDDELARIDEHAVAPGGEL